MSLKQRWERLLVDASRPRCLIGASLLRIVAGFAILYQYLINYGQRHYLFGPDSVYPYTEFQNEIAVEGKFSLLALSDSSIFFESIFHGGILIAFLWLIGWRTRILTPLNYIFWISLHNRFSVLWDGGDNLMTIALVFLCFADVGAHFGMRARRSCAQGDARPRVAGLLHNAAMLAIAFQVCLVYAVAGLSKVQGEAWQNGTALYYALRAPEYTWPGMSDLIFENAPLVVLLSYATVGFQVAFPFLLFGNRRTRILAVALGISFHLGIGAFMGLVTFALFMIALDLALIGDAEYRLLAETVRSRTRPTATWLRDRLGRLRPASKQDSVVRTTNQRLK